MATACKYCGATIGWVETEKGERMPVEPGAKSFITRDGITYQGFECHWDNCQKRRKAMRENKAGSKK